MMRVALVGLLLFGCGEKKPEEKPAEPAKPAGEPAPPRPSEPVRIEPESSPRGLVGGGQMVHCPTASPGAQTSLALTADSVELTVVAKDEKSALDIRADARHLKEVAQKDPAAVKHTGEGEGGGGLGKCPVVLKDTLITITEIEGGAKIALKPAKPEQLEWLKKEVEARLAKTTKTP
jgi:hypothetical protein